jgi:hypothetical protein
MTEFRRFSPKLKTLWNNINKNDVDIKSLKKKDLIFNPRTFTKKINTLEYVLVQISDLTPPGSPDITYKLYEDNIHLQNLIEESAIDPLQDIATNFSLQSSDLFYLELRFDNLYSTLIPFLHITPILETELGFQPPNERLINEGGIIPEFNYLWKKINNQQSYGYFLKMRLQLYIDDYEGQVYPVYFRLKISSRNPHEWQEIETNKV